MSPYTYAFVLLALPLVATLVAGRLRATWQATGPYARSAPATRIGARLRYAGGLTLLVQAFVAFGTGWVRLALPPLFGPLCVYAAGALTLTGSVLAGVGRLQRRSGGRTHRGASGPSLGARFSARLGARWAAMMAVPDASRRAAAQASAGARLDAAREAALSPALRAVRDTPVRSRAVTGAMPRISPT